MLEIPDALHESMVRHARGQAPAECCGLVAGESLRATELFPLSNELASPIAYRADPADLFAAFRAMRDRRLDLVAIYHSHPNSPAIPSRVDLRENYYGEVPRIIISLAGRVPVVKAFRLFADRFEEVDFVRLARHPAP